MQDFSFPWPSIDGSSACTAVEKWCGMMVEGVTAPRQGPDAGAAVERPDARRRLRGCRGRAHGVGEGGEDEEVGGLV
jgi:hypothetical protein